MKQKHAGLEAFVKALGRNFDALQSAKDDRLKQLDETLLKTSSDLRPAEVAKYDADIEKIKVRFRWGEDNTEWMS